MKGLFALSGVFIAIGGIVLAQSGAEPNAPAKKNEHVHVHPPQGGGVIGPTQGSLPPGTCISLLGVSEKGAKLCNTSPPPPPDPPKNISYTVGADGSLTVGLGDGGSAAIGGFVDGGMVSANVTINGTGNGNVSIQGSGCTINNNLGGTPATGTMSISGNNNTVNCGSPGAPDGGTTTINIFSGPPPHPPNQGVYTGNTVVPQGKNKVQTMGYNANGQPEVKNTINP